MKNLLRTPRFLTIFALSFLVFAFPAVPSAQAKQVSSPAGTPASLQALRNQGEQQCIQPPQHLNLETLSDAQLSLYGLPDRSILESAPAFWSVQLAHYQHRTCGTGPAAPNYRFSPHVTGYPQNWAGNWATGGRGTYRQAYVFFNVPWVSGPVNSLVGFWAGVGGQTVATNPVMLVQAGVGVQVRQGSGGKWLYNYAWWEVVNNDGTCCTPVTMPLAIYPGDSISVAVTSNYQNDGYDYFSVCNETRSACANPVYHYGDFSDSATGECIGEEPNPPANFGTENLTGCGIVNNSGTFNGIGDWPHNYSYLTVSGGTLVSVGHIDSTGENFPLTYCSKLGRGDFCG